MPLSSIRLNHEVSTERASSGVKDLDTMLEGKGFFKGASILVSGTAGSGKSSLAAHFVDEACRQRKRCLYIAFEESAAQATRNMRSIGIDLGPLLEKGQLHFHAWRPTQHGLEMHLQRIHELVEEFDPQVVVIDPITNLVSTNVKEVHGMLLRLVDFLKDRQITAMFISLTGTRGAEEQTEVGISSLMDTWILLRDLELNGERNRCLYVLKSRRMAHSNQIREFIMTSRGVQLLPVYVGGANVYTGSARLAEEARERALSLQEEQAQEDKRHQLSSKRKVLQSQIAALSSELSATQSQFFRLKREQKVRQRLIASDKFAMSRMRGVTSSEERSG